MRVIRILLRKIKKQDLADFARLKMKSKILFLTDGSTKIGMGHVFRSMNLASKLKQKYDVFFLTRELTSKKIISKKFRIKYISSLDYDAEKRYYDELKPQLVIIDKMNERKRTLDLLKKNSIITLAIDYTGNNKHLIDYAINILYQKTGKKSKNTFSSFKYAIINPNFKFCNQKLRKQVKSVLVLQGGSDTHCFTPKILDSLKELKDISNINVILGPSFSCYKKLEKVVSNYPKKITILKYVKNMNNVYSKNDLAITAAGMTLLELACVGLPSVIVCAEKFEIETARMMQKKGFGVNLGYGINVSKSEIKKNVEHIMQNYSLRKKMSLNGPKIIDGNGIYRVVKLIDSLIQ